MENSSSSPSSSSAGKSSTTSTNNNANSSNGTTSNSNNNASDDNTTTATLGCGGGTSEHSLLHPPVPTTSSHHHNHHRNSSSSSSTSSSVITLNISTTTGGNFTVLVDQNNSVETLKKTVSKKLRVSKDRICLLHRERELQDGTIRENNLCDGAKVILIPNVETGLLAQRPESTVMQALESLNDSQVNDFLSGKSPLNLNMRLGDHMMIIQLQLSTVNPPPTASSSSSSAIVSGLTEHDSSLLLNNNNCPSSSSRSRSSASVLKSSSRHHHHYHHHSSSSSNNNSSSYHQRSSSRSHTCGTPSVVDAQATDTEVDTDEGELDLDNLLPISSPSISHNNNDNSTGNNNTKEEERCFEYLEDGCVTLDGEDTTSKPLEENSLVVPPEEIEEGAEQEELNIEANTDQNEIVDEIMKYDGDEEHEMENNNGMSMEEQSPIKSLSNLVSSPIINVPVPNVSSSSASQLISSGNSSLSQCGDPISAKLTSCLCKRLDTSSSVTSGSFCDPISCPSRGTDFSPMTSKSAMDLTTGPTSSHVLNANSGPPPPARTSRNLWLHKTANNPILKSKSAKGGSSSGNNLLRRAMSNPLDGTSSSVPSFTPISTPTTPVPSSSSSVFEETMATPDLSQSTTTEGITVPTMIDSRALAEASRNLTQTLKKLSKEVFTNKVDLSENNSKKIGTGAVIESMKHHGKGIYSGTFSGTLNPALQDRYGRPKRDISTIIHILNDLLSATPQYRRGASISLDTNSSTSLGHHHSSSKSSRQSSSRRHHHHHHHHHGHHHHHHHQSSSSSSHDQCSKCTAYSSNSGQSTTKSGSSTKNCVYGECNGHYATTVNSGCSGGGCKQHSYGNGMSSSSTNYQGGGVRACICNVRSQQPQQVTAHQATSLDLSTKPDTMELDQHRNPLNPSVASRSYCQSDGSLAAESGQHSMVPTCCSKCSSVAIENNKIKYKLDQLKLVMQQKKERREARKLKNTPYGSVSTMTTTIVTPPVSISNTTVVTVPKNPPAATTKVVEKIVNSIGNGESENSGSADVESVIINNSSESSANSSPDSSILEATTTASSTEAGGNATTEEDSEQQAQQQQQQNHLVEEVDTAA